MWMPKASKSKMADRIIARNTTVMAAGILAEIFRTGWAKFPKHYASRRLSAVICSQRLQRFNLAPNRMASLALSAFQIRIGNTMLST
jgi:hypothetical protein